MNLHEKIERVRSFLFDPGEPLSEWISLEDGGSYQQFQNVNFYQNPDGECFEVHGAILAKYVEFRETSGDLGYPVSDEMDNANVEGGKWNQFQNGYITWDPVNWTEVTLTQDMGQTDLPIEEDKGTTGVRTWQAVFQDTESTIEEQTTACAQVRSERDLIPQHVKTHPKGFFYFGKVNTKPSNISAGTVEEWIWDEIHSEGSFDSINAYDNMLVTWGKGIAKTTIAVILKKMFSESEALQSAFANVGISLGDDGAIQVLNTNTCSIDLGDQGYKAMKADVKLLDFLVEISGNTDFEDLITSQQWAFVMSKNASLIQYAKANNWSEDAVKLTFHFNWWLPAFGWNSHGAEYQATGGDPTRIILLFKRKQTLFQSELIGHLKVFAGNAFSKYISLEKYRSELPESESSVFSDGGISYYVPA